MSAQPSPGPPWRVLIWDPSGAAGPHWLIGVIDPGDALASEAKLNPDPTVHGWVARATGLHNPQLTSMPGALCWRIHEGDQP